MKFVRRLVFIILQSAFCISAGCQDFGAGGTGERVVPHETTHHAMPFDITSSATTQATTEPSTRPTRATTRATQVPLTLEQVRQLALQNNLDLKVELINPTIARQSVNAAQAQFEALFTTDARYTQFDSPTASQLESSSSKGYSITPGVTFPLYWGGSLNFSLPFDQSETNNSFNTLNPAYTNSPTVTLTQPLLRGFGVDANAASIRVAFYRYQESEATTKLEVIRVLANADRAYWRLYAAKQVVIVRKQEYDLAFAQLERARRQVAQGKLADVDVVRAESGVADKVEAIIIAENDVRQRERELKRILNEPELALGSATIILPATEPRAIAYELDSERLIAMAMAGRMEVLRNELEMLAQNAQVAFARNDMLPLITLNYQYGLNGLGESFDDSLNQVRHVSFTSHQVGFHVEVPIGNEAARSRLRSALASRLQQMATQQQLELQIREEIYNAVDTLEANWQRYLAARKRVILANRVLDVEVRQFNQGLRTSTDVLDAQTRLANARADEIAALTEHQIAQVDVAFATGTLLGSAKISWEATPAPPIR